MANEGHGASVGAWVATFIMIAAFVLGGIALIAHAWWLFWVALGLLVVGAIMARAVNIMDQVSEYDTPGAAGGDPSASTPF